MQDKSNSQQTFSVMNPTDQIQSNSNTDIDMAIDNNIYYSSPLKEEVRQQVTLNEKQLVKLESLQSSRSRDLKVYRNSSYQI